VSSAIKQGNRLLNVTDAAAYLGISAWHVRRLVWRGDLPSVRIGRLVRLDRGDLDEFVDRRKCKNGENFRDCEGALRRRMPWLVALAKALGIDSSPRHGGQDRDVVNVIYPGSGNGRARKLEEILANSNQLFEEWGGLARLKACRRANSCDKGIRKFAKSRP
jgi:excisionase family DNA binding protein